MYKLLIKCPTTDFTNNLWSELLGNYSTVKESVKHVPSTNHKTSPSANNLENAKFVDEAEQRNKPPRKRRFLEVKEEKEERKIKLIDSPEKDVRSVKLLRDLEASSDNNGVRVEECGEVRKVKREEGDGVRKLKREEDDEVRKVKLEEVDEVRKVKLEEGDEVRKVKLVKTPKLSLAEMIQRKISSNAKSRRPQTDKTSHHGQSLVGGNKSGERPKAFVITLE